MIRRAAILILSATLLVALGVGLKRFFGDDDGVVRSDGSDKTEARPDSSVEARRTMPSPLDSIEQSRTATREDGKVASVESRSTQQSLDVLVTDPEGRPLAGRSVGIFRSTKSQGRTKLRALATDSEGRVRFDDIVDLMHASSATSSAYAVVLSDCLEPAPEVKLTPDGIGDLPVHLVAERGGSLRVQLSPSSILALLEPLQLEVWRYDVAPDEDLAHPEWMPPEKRYRPSISRDEPVTLCVSTSAAAYCIAVKSANSFRWLARRHAVSGPTREGEVVDVTIDDHDLFDGWYLLEAHDESDQPMANCKLGVTGTRSGDYVAYVTTDANGRAPVNDDLLHAYPDPGQWKDTSPRDDTRIVSELPHRNRQSSYMAPVGTQRVVRVRFDTTEVLFEGRILTADGAPLSRVTVRVEAKDESAVDLSDDGHETQKPDGSGAAFPCRCGLRKGIGVRTESDGTFRVRSNCPHRRIAIRLRRPEDRLAEVVEGLPRSAVTLRTHERIKVSGEVVVGDFGDGVAGMLSVVALGRNPHGLTEEILGQVRRSEVGKLSWSVRLDDPWPTSVALRLKATNETIVTSREFLPTGEPVEIPAFDITGRVHRSSFNVVDGSGKPIADYVNINFVDRGGKSVSIQRRSSSAGRVMLFTSEPLGRVTIVAVRSGVETTVDFTEGMTVRVEQTTHIEVIEDE